MKIRYNGNEIEFNNTYRPNEIIIDGEIASMDMYAEAHDGINLRASSSGNILMYRTESGKEFNIPQSRFQNVWQDEVAELIRKSGKTMKAVAEATGIPYRTIQDWRAGKSEPSNSAKYGFREQMNDIIHADRYIFNCLSSNVPSLLVEHAESLDDAIEQLKNIVEIEEITSTKLSKIYPDKKIFVYRNKGTEKIIAIK